MHFTRLLVPLLYTRLFCNENRLFMNTLELVHEPPNPLPELLIINETNRNLKYINHEYNLDDLIFLFF